MDIGGKLADRLVNVAIPAITAHRSRLIPVTVETAMQIQEQFFRLTAAEHQSTLGPMWADMARNADLPPFLRETAKFLAESHGQWATMLGTSLAGTMVGGGLVNMFNVLTTPETAATLRKFPVAIIQPSDAVRLAAQGIWTVGQAATEAGGSGISRDKVADLIDGAHAYPSTGEILDMLNRGAISNGHAEILLTRAGYRPDEHGPLLALRVTELSPDRLAQLVTFGVLTQDQAAPLAAKSGMTGHDFGLLVEGNGEPPPAEMLAMAFRRGAIDATRFRRGLIQGPLRNEWVDLVEKMTRVPMSTADAIEAAVKGHLSDSEGARIASENGLMPEHWPILRATAGNPPGIQEMLTWWNRGILTETEVDQGLRESRLNNKYIPFVKRASEALPPMVTIRQLFAHGVIDQTRAIDLLRQHGYRPDVAGAILQSASAEKTTKERDLTASEVVTLYTDEIWDREAAKSALVDLRYSDDEAEWKLDIADVGRARRYRDAVITRVHAAYVKYLMDETEVTATLDRVGVPATARNSLLNLWDIERQTISRTLTEPQVIAALKAGWLDESGAMARLLGQGYSESDAAVLIGVALKRPGPFTQGQGG